MEQNRDEPALRSPLPVPKSPFGTPGPFESWINVGEDGFITEAGIDDVGRKVGIATLVLENIEHENPDEFNAAVRADLGLLTSAWDLREMCWILATSIRNDAILCDPAMATLLRAMAGEVLTKLREIAEAKIGPSGGPDS